MTTAATSVGQAAGLPSLGRPAACPTLAPRLLLLGVVASFLACCAAGRLLSRVNCLGDFSRFHTHINYLSLYYPTVSQVRSLARDTLDPDKVVVVLGGNSVLHGYGQDAAGNWTRHLQALLGERFQVLNLALPAGETFEFGSVATEALIRDYPRLLFVTNTWAGPMTAVGDPDGRPAQRYFFWQAHARGLLADCPERDARLRELTAGRDESFRELQRQCELDAGLSFHDLWNVFTYRVATTVWWRGALPGRSRAVPAPTATRLSPCHRSHPSGLLRQRHACRAQYGGVARFFVPPAGAPGWREPASPLPGGVRECLPAALRGRTLMLMTRLCPYFEYQLTPEERHDYQRAFQLTVGQYARAGVRAAEVGRGLSPRHYSDHVHLTVAGGRLLAEEVAPLLRTFAGQLGYIPQRAADRQKKASSGASPPSLARPRTN